MAREEVLTWRAFNWFGPCMVVLLLDNNYIYASGCNRFTTWKSRVCFSITKTRQASVFHRLGLHVLEVLVTSLSDITLKVDVPCHGRRSHDEESLHLRPRTTGPRFFVEILEGFFFGGVCVHFVQLPKSLAISRVNILQGTLSEPNHILTFLWYITNIIKNVH